MTWSGCTCRCTTAATDVPLQSLTHSCPLTMKPLKKLNPPPDLTMLKPASPAQRGSSRNCNWDVDALTLRLCGNLASQLMHFPATVPGSWHCCPGPIHLLRHCGNSYKQEQVNYEQ